MAEQAKAAVGNIMQKAGQHDTTIHENVAPAVVHEQITPTRHENITTAVDKEVHQHHYHTSIQPVQDKEILPEVHSHRVAGIEHRTFEHGDPRSVEDSIARDAAQFKDERTVTAPTHTHSMAPTVAGEHIHHHVYETVQPVVHRETIQPTVIHTVVPIYEAHHNTAQYHSASALPAITMEDFKKQNGTLIGQDVRTDRFQVEPASVGGESSEGPAMTKSA